MSKSKKQRRADALKSVRNSKRLSPKQKSRRLQSMTSKWDSQDAHKRPRRYPHPLAEWSQEAQEEWFFALPAERRVEIAGNTHRNSNEWERRIRRALKAHLKREKETHEQTNTDANRES